ncbi:MlaD family protein [Fontivita pretiosa]|uniref:MlaD family protein n=1 Tax=Fontivita pretiosa TaxID=2989684 RepID=UPI003D16BD06
MQDDRNSLKAGLFIVASIVLAIGIIVAIKGVGRFLEPVQRVTVRFDLKDDIGGLSPGDEVRIGGAKVGIVRGVELVPPVDGAGEPAVAVHFSVPRRFVLRRDAVVSIQSTVTGVSVLNISSLGSAEPLAAGEVLAGRPSALAQLLAAAPELSAIAQEVRSVTLPKINSGIDRTVQTVATYRETAASATEFVQHLRGKIDPIIDRYYAFMDTGRAALQNISELFGQTKGDFRATVANLRDATGTVKQKLPGMMDKADTLLTKITEAVEQTNVALEDVKKVAANTRDASASVRSILLNNRGKIEAMIASLKTTGDNLKHASAEIRRSPWRLLYKPKQGELANLNLYDAARQFADGAGQLNDAALALRDALQDPDVDEATVQKLVEKLDTTFANFTTIEQELWEQVRQ